MERNDRTGLPCPACRVDLVMGERHGVEIDYCPRCRGVWLDRGELDRIIERSAADPRTAPPRAAAQFLPPDVAASPWGPPRAPSIDPAQCDHGRHGDHGVRHGDHSDEHDRNRVHRKGFIERLFD